MVQDGDSPRLDRFVDVFLNDFRAMLVIEVPRYQSIDVHRRAVNGLGPRHFLAGDKEKVLADVPLQFDRLGVDELVVFAQDDKIVSMIMIPLSDDRWFRVGVPA